MARGGKSWLPKLLEDGEKRSAGGRIRWPLRSLPANGNSSNSSFLATGRLVLGRYY